MHASDAAKWRHFVHLSVCAIMDGWMDGWLSTAGAEEGDGCMLYEYVVR